MSAELSTQPRAIRATYRLQFHEGFRLADATALVPYLHDLGISHIYASPLTTATPHSQHGYDVCDFQRLNPELGTEEDLQELVTALRERGMGLVIDIVPNHMAASASNPWWQDMLAHGQESRYAKFFDVDWELADPRNRGKVLLPVLGGPYPEVLAQKQIQIKNEGGVATLCYGENRFPLTVAEALNGGLEKINEEPAALDKIVRSQNYRLMYWKYGDQELNYRRFFNITSLAGVRMEDPEVFDASHQLFKKWVDMKWVDGLRVDHPDGLRDPEDYLKRLRKLAPAAWIVVEKILMPGEVLPGHWPVAGTTGYDFLSQLNSVLVDLTGEPALTDFYGKFTGQPMEYQKVVRAKKRAVLGSSFTAEINRLLQRLPEMTGRDWHWRDFTRAELRAALAELIASYPVYRMYRSGSSGPANEVERAGIELTVKSAQANNPRMNPEIFNLLGTALLAPFEEEGEFIARFQQLTGPAMAKGAEDKAFYCYNRFISLNEVGGDPGRFGSEPKAFHDSCTHLQSAWSDTMLASTTHDTKRGEDMRARLNVLSEIPEKWCAAVERWAAMNKRHRPAGFDNRNAEYFIYQTLVGAWPVSCERMLGYMEKAAREAGELTQWGEPNEEYEKAQRDFVAAIMADAAFMGGVAEFVSGISRAGFTNSLAQTLIKLAAPGVPDIYQGCELWNFSLVDPDNRMPVDFKFRRHLLRQVKDLPGDEIWKSGDDPMIKLWLTCRVLNFRATRPELFAHAAYTPLYATGGKRNHLLAFQRGENMIVLAQRLTQGLQGDWRDTTFHLPPGEWRSVLTDETFNEQTTLVKTLLARFPVALLVRAIPEA